MSKVLRAKSNIKNFLKKFANKSNNDVQCEVKLQFCELKIVMQPAGEPHQLKRTRFCMFRCVKHFASMQATSRVYAQEAGGLVPPMTACYFM